MNEPVLRNLRLITMLFVFSSVLLFSDSAAQELPADDEWQVLFNGKDLSGWRLLNGEHKVEVRDGVIVGTCIQGLPNGFLATEEKFDDFILELEVKADLLMHNSGIQFRSLSYAGYQDGRVHGYQAEVDVTPQRWSGGIYDEARRGWLYILEDESSAAKNAFKNGQWNKYRIEAIGHTNRIWVNGVPTAHLVDDMTTEGFIALQFHGNSRPTTPSGNHQVRFRDIRIKTENLDPSPYDDIFVVNLIPNHISGQEKEQGFSLLWDGKTIRGWESMHRSEGWEINEGVLTIRSSDDSRTGKNEVLKSEKEYEAFELKFDFKQHEEDGIIGLEYTANGSGKEVLYGRMAAKKTKEAGQWNQGVIKVFPDNYIEYWLNGYKILEYYRDPRQAQKSPVLLSNQGSPVSYRSIKIRDLSK